MKEPTIIINGTKLTKAQAMTVRVAVESLSTSLHHDGLGDDDHGKAMTRGYLGAIEGIRLAMYRAAEHVEAALDIDPEPCAAHGERYCECDK